MPKAPKTFTTLQVARIIGVHKVTLQNWLLAGKLDEPKKVRIGNVEARVWTAGDIERVRRYKSAHYRKGRGRKPRGDR